MPANDRDKKVKEEAQVFCRNKSLYPIQCKHFSPTLEELQSTTFSDFVRNVVLSRCREGYNDDDEVEEDRAVEDRNETRTRSIIDCCKRHSAKNGKINYDYGEL